MRNVMRTVLLAAAVGSIGVGQAFAGGDASAALLRQKNAICEMQRRGQGPLYPSMCLPELPPGPVYHTQERR